MDSIIATLVIGAIAGWLAGLIVRGAGFGLIGNIVIGILGALVAGWILPQLGVVLAAGTLGEILDATHRSSGLSSSSYRWSGAPDASPHSRNEGCFGRFFLLKAKQNSCGPKSLNQRPNEARIDDIYRHQGLCRDRRPQGRRQCLDRARAPAPDQVLARVPSGTGKTVLAEEVAKAIKAPLMTWHIKSTTKAQQGLYEYDAVSRLRDSQLGDARVSDIANYIKRGKLWDAFTAPERPVLLIDEIDKADIEFPNDLLLELDRMEFFVYETGENIKAAKRPIVMITSNNEKELPDAFLRRCFFHYIKFPDADTMGRIVDVHFPNIKKRLVEEALRIFFEVREVPGLKKKPSTSELLDWLKLLLNEDISPEMLRERDPRKLIPPLHGALLKNEQDVHLFERLAFLSRREV